MEKYRDEREKEIGRPLKGIKRTLYFLILLFISEVGIIVKRFYYTFDAILLLIMKTK